MTVVPRMLPTSQRQTFPDHSSLDGNSDLYKGTCEFGAEILTEGSHVQGQWLFVIEVPWPGPLSLKPSGSSNGSDFLSNLS
jgi:hypothetical protein